MNTNAWTALLSKNYVAAYLSILLGENNKVHSFGKVNALGRYYSKKWGVRG